MIRDLLIQAEAKGKTGDVAQYLVGAKLMLRLKRDIPVYPANKADRKSWSDQQPRYGDFEQENAIFEVAVGLPDEKHIKQVLEALEATDCEVWLLTREERLPAWKVELENAEDMDPRRVVITSVESFIGQNLAELGGFSAKGKNEQLRQLVDLYNTRWIERVGDLHPKNWSIQNESPPGKLGSQDRRTGPCGRAGFQRSRSLGC
ncbi:MAG: DUF4928 family protein, partial [Phycisphaerae bacterium]